MFAEFIKENWVYVPYERRDKLELNENVRMRLDNELNSRGRITELIPNPFYFLEVERNKRRGRVNRVVLLESEATLYSDNHPLRLKLFQHLKIVPPFVGYGYQIIKTGLTLDMGYYSFANHGDLNFTRNCLRKTRFKERK